MTPPRATCNVHICTSTMVTRLPGLTEATSVDPALPPGAPTPGILRLGERRMYLRLG